MTTGAVNWPQHSTPPSSAPVTVSTLQFLAELLETEAALLNAPVEVAEVVEAVAVERPPGDVTSTYVKVNAPVWFTFLFHARDNSAEHTFRATHGAWLPRNRYYLEGAGNRLSEVFETYMAFRAALFENGIVLPEPEPCKSKAIPESRSFTYLPYSLVFTAGSPEIIALVREHFPSYDCLLISRRSPRS